MGRGSFSYISRISTLSDEFRSVDIRKTSNSLLFAATGGGQTLFVCSKISASWDMEKLSKQYRDREHKTSVANLSSLAQFLELVLHIRGQESYVVPGNTKTRSG